MIRSRCLVVLLIVTCWSAFSGWGQEPAVPQLTRVFPAGAERGQTTTIQVNGKFANESVGVWSSVSGLRWEKLEAENQFQVQIDAEAEVGPIWIRLFDAGGATEVLPFYVGHLSEIVEVEPNDRSDQSQVVSKLPVVVNGVLQQGGDVDHFQVSLQSGQTLVAVVDAERYLRSAVDATLQLVTPDGQILAQNLDYRGLDPQIVWIADHDRDVVVRVFGFPAAPDSTISLGGGEKFIYRLSLTTGAAVEAVTPLAINPSDSRTVIRHGWNISVEEDVWEGTDSEDASGVVMYWPGTVGLLRLPKVQIPSRLAAEIKLPSHEVVQAENSFSPLSLPIVVTGNLQQARQVDSFLFHSPEKKQWRIHVAARELGYAWDPVVEIFQIDDGKRLQRQDDSGSHPDPDWNWVAPTEGLYQLRVFDLNGHAAPHHWYRLAITEVLPEAKLTVESTSYRGKVGEPVEIVVSVDRRHGFAADLEFELAIDDSLVDGSALKLEPIRSVAADDSGKQVTLKIASASSFNGPVRMFARNPADTNTSIKVVEKTRQLEQIWLSIVEARN